jgi:chromosome segregation ATPase
MVHIADIWERRGETMKSVELWKAARPLFQRSSQKKDVVRTDRKLADVDPAIIEEYEKSLQRIAELKTPAEELEEAHVEEDEGVMAL